MERLTKSLFVILIAVFVELLLACVSPMWAEGKWSVSSNLQFNNGNYIFEKDITTYFLYGGIRYRSDEWNIFANIPLMAQNGDQITNIGGAFLPSVHHENEGTTTGSHHNRGMINSGILSNFDMGLGDVYLGGEYLIFPEENGLPFVSGNVKLKIPTANTVHNFGSGEFDYGFGFTFRKNINTYITFIDLGFWSIGNPQEIDYKDIHTLGAGLGRLFANGRYAAMFYFENYSKILDELEANRQFSLGLNYRSGSNLIFSVIGAAGLSKTSPNFSFSSGIEWTM